MDKEIGIFLQTENFFCRYDRYPVSKGHYCIVPKKHIASLFDLKEKEILEFFQLLKKSKTIVDKEFKPDAYNIGINEGEAAGRTLDHLHVHVIPRYIGDVENPRGGVRNIIPSKADYYHEAKKDASNHKYLKNE